MRLSAVLPYQVDVVARDRAPESVARVGLIGPTLDAREGSFDAWTVAVYGVTGNTCLIFKSVAACRYLGNEIFSAGENEDV